MTIERTIACAASIRGEAGESKLLPPALHKSACRPSTTVDDNGPDNSSVIETIVATELSASSRFGTSSPTAMVAVANDSGGASWLRYGVCSPSRSAGSRLVLSAVSRSPATMVLLATSNMGWPNPKNLTAPKPTASTNAIAKPIRFSRLLARGFLRRRFVMHHSRFFSLSEPFFEPLAEVVHRQANARDA